MHERHEQDESIQDIRHASPHCGNTSQIGLCTVRGLGRDEVARIQSTFELLTKPLATDREAAANRALTVASHCSLQLRSQLALMASCTSTDPNGDSALPNPTIATPAPPPMHANRRSARLRSLLECIRGTGYSCSMPRIIGSRTVEFPLSTVLVSPYLTPISLSRTARWLRRIPLCNRMSHWRRLQIGLLTIRVHSYSTSTYAFALRGSWLMAGRIHLGLRARNGAREIV